MSKPADTDEFRGQWFAYPVDFFLRDRDPGGPPASIELRAGADPRSSRCQAARSASARAPCPARTSSWPGRRS